MKISKFAVRRPVTIIMIVLGILLMGAVSLGKLAIDLFPEMNFPIAAVIANYPGAGPEEVENQVTRPLEDVLGTVNNVETINSTSSSGSSMVLIMFNWGTDMEFATLQMREKVDLIKGGLPDDVGTPTVLKMDPTMMPILQATVSGDKDLATLQQITEDVIKSRLERVEGVASVSITGGLVNEVEVNVDPAKLDVYGLSVGQVTQTLQGENMNLSSGEIEDGKEKLLVRTIGEFKRIEDFEQIIINGAGGNQVKLKDITEIKFAHQTPTQYTRVNQQPSVSINIMKQTGSNVVQVADKLNKEIEALEKELPAGIEFDTIMDQSEFIKLSINQVARNTIVGGILAVLVLLLFLRNIRSTLIIGLAIPFSVISTFILVYFAGITLNVMSLGGLALGVGMMVDSAIVILENIYRYRQMGYGRIDAAVKGSSEVGSAVMASTLTTVAVFLPIVFVEGLASELFKQLALTVSFSLLASLFVALTLIPMLSSKILKVDNKDESPSKGVFDKLADLVQRALNALDERYRILLSWSLKHRKKVVITVTLALFGSFALVPMVGTEFIPATDTGEIAIQVELPKGSVLSDTSNAATEVEDILKEVPEVQTVFTSIGTTGQGMGAQGSEISRILVKVGGKSERDRSSEEIMEDMRNRLKPVTGAKITVSQNEPQMGGGSPVDIAIKGNDLETLETLADQVADEVEGVQGTREVKTSLEESRPEIQLLIDRQRAGHIGLTASQIAASVRTTISGTTTSAYRLGGKEYDIRVKVGEGAPDLAELERLTITAPNGTRVPLREVAQLSRANGPTSIQRENQSRVVNVTADVTGRDLGTVVAEIDQALKKVNIPQGYMVEYGGQNEQMADSFASLALALLLSIVLVYMVMASQFESLMHPFIIMFAMPTTFIGVVAGLAITGRSLSVPAFIGVIMLAGIVVNNAIVLVDYINTLRRSEGLSREDAIVKAGPTRLRPILMTTLTTVLGLLPLTLGLGEGAETQAPMATVVVSGLTTSTLLTLIFVPVIYTIMDDAGEWVKRKRGISKVGVSKPV